MLLQNKEKYDTLKVKFMRENSYVCSQILYQDEAEIVRGCGIIFENNGYSIRSELRPGITSTSLFVKGTQSLLDNNIGVYDFGTESAAINYITVMSDVIRAYNEKCLQNNLIAAPASIDDTLIIGTDFGLMVKAIKDDNNVCVRILTQNAVLITRGSGKLCEFNGLSLISKHHVQLTSDTFYIRGEHYNEYSDNKYHSIMLSSNKEASEYVSNLRGLIAKFNFQLRTLDENLKNSVTPVADNIESHIVC